MPPDYMESDKKFSDEGQIVNALLELVAHFDAADKKKRFGKDGGVRRR